MSHAFLAIIAGGSALWSLVGVYSQGRPANDLPGRQTRDEIIKRLNENFEKSEGNLAKTDPREETQKVQELIIKDLDELIKQRNNPPPGAAPRGEGKDPKETPAKRSRQDESRTNKRIDSDAPKKPTSADRQTGFWGEPRKMRLQEIEIYGKQRFLPKYEELLRQYYRTISESDRQKDN